MEGGAGGFAVWLLAKVVLILGILKFAQDAPALIKDFFGNSGNFSLKSPKKQLEENKLAMGAIGAARGTIGGATAYGVTKANQFKNLKTNWTDKNATTGTRLRQIGSLLSASSFKKGYQATKDTKSLDDWGQNVKATAVEVLKDKGSIYKAKQSFSNIGEDLSNVYKKNYFTQDTKALKDKNTYYGSVAELAKSILSVLEDDSKFKGLVSVYDNAIANAQKEKRYDLVPKITEEKVSAMNEMRHALMMEKLEGREAKVNYSVESDIPRAMIVNAEEITKGINTEMKENLDNLNSALSDHFDMFNEAVNISATNLGEGLNGNLTSIKDEISGGNTKLIKNIKNVADDASKAAKAAMIETQKVDNKDKK